MAEKDPDSGPESSAPITSLQSGDQQSLENVGNLQNDSRKREIVAVNSYEGAVINQEIHHHHYYSHEKREENATNDSKPGQRNDHQQIQEDDMVQVGHDIYMDEKQPLRRGYQVYKGEQRLGTVLKTIDLAVKIFRLECADVSVSSQTESKSDWYKRYCEEVHSMIRLDHPNIVRFVHCDQRMNKPGEYYVAMKLCHGLTLGDIDLGALTQEQRINVFLQICHGSKHLHDNRVAHRDLKPTNILFSIDGKKAVVSDFGLSKEVVIKHEKTQTIIKRSSTRYGGTEGWSPFEMIKKQTQEDQQPDFLKSDIFSLGLVGNFVLCNKHHPFSDALDQCFSTAGPRTGTGPHYFFAGPQRKMKTN